MTRSTAPARTTPDTAGLDRRTVLRGAAWAVPVVALAVAAPAAAASDIEVGAYQLAGSCGVPGVLGPGFTLTASPSAPLPVGTTFLVSGTGVANIGVFSVQGGTATASQTVLSATSRLFTLTSQLAAGATVAFRTTLSTSVRWVLNGSTALPADYVGTEAKTTATVTSTLTGCSAV